MNEVEKEKNLSSDVNTDYTEVFFLFICSRLYQAAKLYLFNPSSGLYSCPLAMTDGAAKIIQVCNFLRSWK